MAVPKNKNNRNKKKYLILKLNKKKTLYRNLNKNFYKLKLKYINLSHKNKK